MPRPRMVVWPPWSPPRRFWLVLAWLFGVVGGVCLAVGAAAVM